MISSSVEIGRLFIRKTNSLQDRWTVPNVLSDLGSAARKLCIKSLPRPETMIMVCGYTVTEWGAVGHG